MVSESIVKMAYFAFLDSIPVVLLALAHYSDCCFENWVTNVAAQSCYLLPFSVKSI